MKGWIEDKHCLTVKPSCGQLRRWTREAWEAVKEVYLDELIGNMPRHCKDVIVANGTHIRLMLFVSWCS